jgi:hypothetical protein
MWNALDWFLLGANFAVPRVPLLGKQFFGYGAKNFQKATAIDRLSKKL